MNLFELYWLIFAHFFGDFTLQHDWIAKNKFKDPWTLLAHCFLWAGSVSFVLMCFDNLTLWKILFLFFGHLICDYLKHNGYHKLPFHVRNSVDQGFHLVQILIVWLL